ncbi:uncharacterized protein LOC135491376 [Lineus longissimus]|uniref:uncharacterized protein LOC135491376 n=1 Tax=Lineus longissimus TaxID=88925 RepID=UPI00315C9F1C
MGNGASIEGDISTDQPPPQGGQGGIQRPPQSAVSRATSVSGKSDAAWRKLNAIKSAASGLKIIRPGRPIVSEDEDDDDYDFKNVVVISKSGFSIPNLTIVEGEVVVFAWEAESGGNGYNVVQVVHDGEQFRPVIGGIYSGPLSREGNYEHLFMVEGEYKFVSAGLRCTPLTITVRDREDIRADLRDTGFLPNVIHVEQGNAIKWQWKQTIVPRMMYEVQYCSKHCSIVKPEKNGHPVAVSTGNFRKEFKQAGIFYFMSDSPDKSAKAHFCAVHVKEIKQEHRIEVLDKSFKPMILLIEEGDKVWWNWDKITCKKHHCVYQIEPPAPNHKTEESFKPRKDGFRWPQPSKHGTMAHLFKEPGVYYYSDHSFHEAAEYIGTIIVRPVQRELQVQLTPDGFSPDMLYARTGDRIWWNWNLQDMDPSFAIMEIEKCLTPMSRSPIQDFDCKINHKLQLLKDKCQYIDDVAARTKTTLGIETTQVNNVGVYHYRVADSPNTISTSSIIVQPGPRNYTVHVTDKGFVPKVLSVSLEDRVWWVWQGTTKPHNIIQVSHQGMHIKDGFVSGAPIDSPSAYVRQFQKAGVFYYISSNVEKFFGAVVVSTQSRVHEIAVNATGHSVDPLPINVNDVVAWTFKGLRQQDVELITNVDQILDAQHSSNVVAPRRCMNRVFKETPLFHFYSKSFWNKGAKKEQSKFELESRVSSILVNAGHDSTVVRVDGKGFHPPKINVLKGCSVLWTWKGLADQEHNIIHVNAPDSEQLRNSLTPLSVIQGAKSFNSGKPVASNSFLYTFDDTGVFCVASQGAPGFAGVVNVLGKEVRAALPVIVSDRNGGVVDRYTRVKLNTTTPDAKIYYTVSGKTPELHEENIRTYHPERGICLRQPGLCIIRSIAVSDSLLPSHIMASKRFWVLETGVEDQVESSASEAEDEGVKKEALTTTPTWQWWGCIPKIKGCFTGPGIIEIFWEPPKEESLPLIRGYQIYLNGISYCELFPPDHNSLNIAGLAGGRTYDVWLEVYPNNDMFLPHKSNHLMMHCDKTIQAGGPLVSLEVTEDERSMALVWMSISSDDFPVAGYKLFLNGKQCGSMVVPDDDSNRCKVVIEECTPDYVYRVAVMAVPKDENQKPRLSNQLELSLPLETQNIILPPVDLREDDPDMYREYIEVREGSGYLPAMDKGEPEPEAKKVDSDSEEEIERPQVAPVKQQTEEAAPPPQEETEPEPKQEPEPEPESESESSSESEGAVVEVDDTADLHAPKPDVAIAAAAVSEPVPAEFLPRPKVSVMDTQQTDSISVEWRLTNAVDPEYKLERYEVKVIGLNFQHAVNSNMSYTCIVEMDGEKKSAVEHRWDVTDKTSKCSVNGLVPGQKYSVCVVANYSLMKGATTSEVQVTSDVLYYTTAGAPDPPKLHVQGVDNYQVGVEWEKPALIEGVEVSGYNVLVDGKQLGTTLNPTTSRTIIDSLVPGITISIQVVACTTHAVGNSQASTPLLVSCPLKPPVPTISQQPSYKKGCVVIGWEKPTGREFAIGEDIVLYSIYLDGVWHGEVKAMGAADRKGYQYYLTDLLPGQSYDVTVKSVAGQLKIDPNTDHVNCLSESDHSNSVQITCPAPPMSPMIRIESMTTEGIDITWQTPQQFGDAQISGYQILKNGKLYGSTVPPDVQSLRIKDVELGEKVSLQLVALTEHPVGRHGQRDGMMSLDGDSGIDGSNPPDDKAHPEFGDKYAACKAGPKLTFRYTGLVQPPSRVWSEKVTGHSAIIVWNKLQRKEGRAGDRLRPHHVAPDSYQVTWWPGSKPEDDINSQYTSDDHLLITGLKHATTYTVIVEARKLQKYSALQEEEGAFPEGLANQTFILTGQSEKMTLLTARPPDPACNLGITSTTCHSIQVAWDPPREHGVEVIGLRVDCYPVSQIHRNPPFSQELMPDVTETTVDGLCECTEHIVVITAITEEFFDQLPDGHTLRKIRALPAEFKDIPESMWLPKSTIIAVTSGTDVPSKLQAAHLTMDSVTLKWKPARVYGSNRLLGQVVRWNEVRHSVTKREDDVTLASHMNLNPNDNHVTIHNLEPGLQYKFVVEAVVSVKTTVDEEKDAINSEKKNRRMANVPSQPVIARTRAPCEPPKVLLSGYTPNTIQLYWEKPLLYTILGHDIEDRPKLLKRSLEGYKLEINGKLHMRLGPTAQTCTLTKCKPGKMYNIVVSALTCTEEVKKERKRKARGLSDSQAMSLSTESKATSAFVDDDDEDDEAPSEPLIVTLPIAQTDNICDFRAFYVPKTSAPGLVGDVHVEWKVLGDGDNIGQFNVTWYSHSDPVRQKKLVAADARKCTVPVTLNRCSYEVSIEPVFKKESIPAEIQSLQVVIPGPPDAPEIFRKSVSSEEFVIEWGEPRMYGGTKLKGYQVYMNDKKVGNMLSHIHHKAVIPCRPNRNYSISMKAISGTPDIADSAMSNKLFISTHEHGRTENGSVQLEDWNSVEDERELMVKVTKVTDSAIHLDWSTYMVIEGCTGFKVQWSSVAQPAQRETRLSINEMTCVIKKCFPGTNHYIRVLVVGEQDEVYEKSRQLIVQTSAPPDTPVVCTRAVNFKYIAIQWDKPGTYGDALVTGYKVFINGIVEALLGPDQHTYSFTQGKQCLEYAFQVQALSIHDNLHSKPSEPLVITWPGVKSPVLKRAPTVHSNAVRVQWESPYTTDGVCCGQYKLYCLEDDTDKVVQIISPIHPDTLQVDLHNLKKGSYRVYLEVYVHGNNDVVRSEAIDIRPSISPDPPVITVTVVGLDERRQMEKITADLINKRDKLIALSNNRPLGRILMEGDSNSSRAAESIAQIDTMLEDCFQSFKNYTGHLLAHVSWSCVQSNPDIHVTGYKVLVDGKQYGCSLQPGIKNVRIKLNLNQPSHRLSMIAVADQPYANSVESNTVELLTEPFQPFSFFCFNGVHHKDTKWPSHGCCQYSDTFKTEKRPNAKPANPGLLKRHLTPPPCNVRDVFDGQYKPLLLNADSDSPTALLFWTRWCHGSVKLARHFVRFAKQYSSSANFVTVACGLGNDAIKERQELVHTIMENGWKDELCVKHFTNQMAPTVDQPQDASIRAALENKSKKKGKKNKEHHSIEINKLFGVQGVPSIVIIHPDNYVAFHGRYCAIDYTSFEKYMRQTLDTVMSADPPDLVDIDEAIDNCVDGIGDGLQADNILIHTPGAHGTASASPMTAPKRRLKSPRSPARSRPQSSKRPSRPTSSHRPTQRPTSSNKLFMRSKQPKEAISVSNMRPLSAGNRTDGVLIPANDLGGHDPIFCTASQLYARKLRTMHN